MRVYESDNIRNIAIVGHGAAGKTTLTSAMLFDSGAVSRLGRVEDGNTVTDWEDEEIERKITISTGVAHCEWNKKKINILDTPGYRPFLTETKLALRVADAALVVIDSVAGVEVQTEKVWEFCDEFGLPRIIILNKMDRDNASFERALESVAEVFGRAPVPIQIPLGAEKDFAGVVSILNQRAYRYEKDHSGKFQEIEIPAEYRDEAARAREKLVEMVAEGSDELMEKFFSEGTLEGPDLLAGLRGSVRQRNLVPVLCASASLNIAIAQILDAIVEFVPSPAQIGKVQGIHPQSKEPIERKVSVQEPYAAYVFKTVADPFTGRINIFRLYSGAMKSDTQYHNQTKEKNEKFGPLQALQGKSMSPLGEAQAGDFFAVTKLRETTTGDTFCDPAHPIVFPPVEIPEPSITFAIEPKSRGDEDKISSALARIAEEDPAIKYYRDPQTKQLLLAGSGQLHVDLPRGGSFEFVDEIFGGAIPRNFIPAVEKGIVDAAAKGFLAGYPVVDFKVTLYDGSYHPVDSSELAFKVAGSLAFKKGMEQANPVLLEPIMDVEIYAPQEYAGDLMGDLTSRRGRLQGVDVRRGTQVIKAQVPMAEMVSYAPVLTSMTQGRGTYHMEMSHYDEVPAHIAQKIVDEANKERKGKEEE